jgi:hypothetical protein
MQINKHSNILAISLLAGSLALSGCASVDHTAEFFKIAEASCAKALAVGVVEKSISKSGFTLVMVPKVQGYKDFSAAYLEPTDKYELIYETDAFSACSASMAYEIAKEAGTPTAIKVTYADGSYETTEDLGEYGISHIRYSVSGGLLATSETLDVAKADKRTITYGHLTKDDWAILTIAVDRYLKN